MTTGRQLDRREFLAAAGAGTLLVAVGAPGCSRVDEDLRGVERKPTLTITPLAHVRLDDTGTVTVVCHRSEMGQGIRTTMAMVIATRSMLGIAFRIYRNREGSLSRSWSLGGSGRSRATATSSP
jgi:CO/xanthine dehydrogenase Mo-binding subunit